MVPFVAALILAPLIPATPGWAGLILPDAYLDTSWRLLGGLPQAIVFALLFFAYATIIGALPYLAFGGPLFFRSIRSGNETVKEMAATALAANLFAAPLYILVGVFLSTYFGDSALADVISGFGWGAGIFVLGIPFSAIWGATFALLYKWFSPRNGEIDAHDPE